MRSLHAVLNRIVFDFLPIPLAMVGNVIIIAGLRKGRQFLQAASVTDRALGQRRLQERQATKLLLMISILFLIFCAPLEIFAILAYIGVMRADTHAYDLGSEICRVFSLLNHSTNFIVYAVMNKKYREGYKAILLSCFCRPVKNDQNCQGLHLAIEDRGDIGKY